MAFLEPFLVPGLDRAVLELVAIFGVILVSGAVVTISSIVGVVRAVRRRKRGGHSLRAVVLAAIAASVAVSWLLYWVADDLLQRSTPINGFLAINLALCAPPLSWLTAAIHANAARGKGRVAP